MNFLYYIFFYSNTNSFRYFQKLHSFDYKSKLFNLSIKSDPSSEFSIFIRLWSVSSCFRGIVTSLCSQSNLIISIVFEQGSIIFPSNKERKIFLKELTVAYIIDNCFLQKIFIKI